MTRQNIGEANINPRNAAKGVEELARREEEGVVDQQTASAPVNRGGSDDERQAGGEASVGVPPVAGELRGRAGDPAEGKR